MTAFRLLSGIFASALAGVAGGAWLCHVALPDSEVHDPIWSGIGVGLVFAAAFFHFLAFPFGAQAMEGQPPWRHWSGLISVLLCSFGIALFAVSLFLPPIAVTSSEWANISLASGAAGSMLKFPSAKHDVPANDDGPTDDDAQTSNAAATDDAPWLFHIAVLGSAFVTTVVAGERLAEKSIQWANVQQFGLILGAIVVLLVAIALGSATWKRVREFFERLSDGERSHG